MSNFTFEKYIESTGFINLYPNQFFTVLDFFPIVIHYWVFPSSEMIGMDFKARQKVSGNVQILNDEGEISDSN